MATQFAVTSRLMQGFRFAAPVDGLAWAVVPFRDGARPSELLVASAAKLLHWRRDPEGDGLWAAEDVGIVGTVATGSAAIAAGSSAVDNLVHYYVVDDRSRIFTRSENDATWRQLPAPTSDRGAIASITGIKLGSGPGMGMEPFLVACGTGSFGNDDDTVFLRLTDQGGWQPIAYAQGAIVDWCPAVFDLPNAPASPERRGVAFITDGARSASGPRTPAQPDRYVGVVDGATVEMYTAMGKRLFAVAAGPSGLTHDRLFVTEGIPGGIGNVVEITPSSGSTGVTPVTDAHALSGNLVALWLGPYETAGTDVVHLFAIGDGLVAKHGDGHGGWGDFHRIDVPFTPDRLIGGSPFAEELEVFVVGADRALYAVWRDPASDDWRHERIDRAAPETEQVISVYAVQIAAYDDDVPHAGLTVDIDVDDTTEFEINGVWQAFGPGGGVSATTNAVGEVNITIPVTSLQCTRFTIKDRANPPTTLAVDPAASILTFVSSRTADQLLAAKTVDADGTQVDLLQGGDRAALAATLAQGLRHAAALAPPATAARAEADVALHPLNDPAVARVVPPGAPPAKAWLMGFGRDAPTFQALTAGEATTLVAARNALPPAESALGRGLGWGDVFGAVTSGFATLVDVVATGATAVLTLAVKGVQYVFEAVVSVPGRVIDLVQEFFRSAGVVFDRLFGWLGFLFDWSDILRAKNAVKHALTTALDFAGAALACVGTTVAGQIDTFRTGVHDRITAVQALLDPSAGNPAAAPVTFDGYRRRFDPQVQPHLAAVNDANAVNIVRHALVNHRAAITVTQPAHGVLDAMVAAADDLTSKLDALAGTGRADPAFVRVLDFVHSLSDRGLAFAAVGVSQLLGVLDDLIQLALKGLKDLVTTIVSAVTAVLEALESALTAEWTIPLISQLYTKVANAPLTTLDLISLAVAIPATTLSKLLYQRSPFPDDTALAAFTNTFTVASLTQHLPGGSTAPTTSTPAPRSVPPEVSAFFGLAALVNRGLFIFTDTALDADPDAGDMQWLNTLALVQEWLAWGVSCPWIDEDGPLGFGDADSFERLVWLFGVVPAGVDSYFYIRDYRASKSPQIARNDGMAGVGATLAFGLIGLGLTVWVGALRTADDPGTAMANAVSLAEGIFDSIPGCLKWMAQIAAPGQPEVNMFARGALAAVDVICGASVVGFMIAEVLSKSPAPPPATRGLGPLALTAV